MGWIGSAGFMLLCFGIILIVMKYQSRGTFKLGSVSASGPVGLLLIVLGAALMLLDRGIPIT